MAVGKIFSVVVFSMIFNIGFAQYGFEININNENTDELPTNFVRNDNGGYIGFINIGWNGGRLYSISANGDTLSVTISKKDTLFRVSSIIIPVVAPDYNYLLTCNGSIDTGSFNDLFTTFIAVDLELNVIWEKTYKFNFYYGISSSAIIQKIDNNFLYFCAPHGTNNMFLFEFSLYGDSLSYKSFIADSAGQIMDITYNSDSSNILLHTIYAHYDPMGPQSQCITLDSNWNQIKVREYPRWLRKPYTALLMQDGYIINGGTYNESYNAIATAYKVKDDSLFTPEYINKLTNPDTNTFAADYQSVDYYYNGCYFVGGTINLEGTYNPSWFYITMLNDTLGIEYEKYIGGDKHYRLSSVTASQDGGVLLVGTKQELGMNPQTDVYIVKLDSTGYITGISGKSDNIIVHNAILYPNPGNNYFNIRTALKNCTLTFFNTAGIRVMETKLDELITHIETSYLPSGQYIYRITNKNKLVEAGTWIKK